VDAVPLINRTIVLLMKRSNKRLVTAGKNRNGRSNNYFYSVFSTLLPIFFALEVTFQNASVKNHVKSIKILISTFHPEFFVSDNIDWGNWNWNWNWNWKKRGRSAKALLEIVSFPFSFLFFLSLFLSFSLFFSSFLPPFLPFPFQGLKIRLRRRSTLSQSMSS